MLIAAAIIIIIIGCIHSGLGERAVLQPLYAKYDLPTAISGVLRVSWHFITMFWFAIAAQLVVMAVAPENAERAFLIILMIAFGISTIVALITSRGKHLSWIGFGAVTGILGYLGLMAP